MKINNCAIAVDNNNHELVSVIENGGEIFVPSNVEIIEFATQKEMNAYIEERGLSLKESGESGE